MELFRGKARNDDETLVVLKREEESRLLMFGRGCKQLQILVPVHMRIAAHSHRDDRVATVISGTWRKLRRRQIMIPGLAT